MLFWSYLIETLQISCNRVLCLIRSYFPAAPAHFYFRNSWLAWLQWLMLDCSFNRFVKSPQFNFWLLLFLCCWFCCHNQWSQQYRKTSQWYRIIFVPYTIVLFCIINGQNLWLRTFLSVRMCLRELALPLYTRGQSNSALRSQRSAVDDWLSEEQIQGPGVFWKLAIVFQLKYIWFWLEIISKSS